MHIPELLRILFIFTMHINGINLQSAIFIKQKSCVDTYTPEAIARVFSGSFNVVKMQAFLYRVAYRDVGS